jgi:hypothetical protein
MDVNSYEKRFLGNIDTLEVHDTQYRASSCRLSDIAPEHRLWYDSLSEAKADREYDNCYWCLRRLHALNEDSDEQNESERQVT